MTLDWCPGIRKACAHWCDAPILQQAFEALERNLESTGLPQIRVFNRDFVNATLSQTNGGIAPIYFLGKGNIEKQVQVSELKKECAAIEARFFKH